jgi:hypothetical protein
MLANALYVLAAFATLGPAVAAHHADAHHARGHAGIHVKHYLGSGALASANNTHLAKRFDNARFTYYAAGQGACGKTNQASDYVRAQQLKTAASTHTTFLKPT